jgi:WD40 repeat protein
MIQRRQFLGTLAAYCVATGSTRCFAKDLSSDNLNWECQIVDTLAHNDARRNPVVTGVSQQSNGNLLAIVGDDHHVCLYDTRLKTYPEHLERHSDWVRSVAFSPDGKKLVTAGNDRSMMLWNVGDWTGPAIVKRHPEAIIQTAFSSNGSRIATVGFEPWLRIYDVTSGNKVTELECACPDNHAVAFSPDGELLAAGGRSGVIRIWSMRDNRIVSEFKAHRQRIRTIEFSADGRLVSAGDDQVVRLTNPKQIDDTVQFPRLPSKLYATALLDGGLMATAGSDNLIHIWQLNDASLIGSLKGHTGTVTSLDYSENRLVSGSYDTQVRIWSTERHTSASPQRHTELQNGWNPRLK